MGWLWMGGNRFYLDWVGFKEKNGLGWAVAMGSHTGEEGNWEREGGR
jgi:hypothetical protein